MRKVEVLITIGAVILFFFAFISNAQSSGDLLRERRKEMREWLRFLGEASNQMNDVLEEWGALYAKTVLSTIDPSFKSMELNSEKKVEEKRTISQQNTLEEFISKQKRGNLQPEPGRIQRRADLCNGGGTTTSRFETKYICGNETLNSTQFVLEQRVLCTRCSNNSIDCLQNCCVSNVTAIQSCTCFIGRKGENCIDFEQFECKFELLSPDLSCHSNPVLTSNPNFLTNKKCRLFSIKDFVEFIFKLECAFQNRDLNFTEYVRQSHFHNNVTLATMHIFDFNRIFDRTFTNYAPIYDRQLTSERNVTFHVNFTNIAAHPRFTSGGRVYFETGFDRGRDVPGLANSRVSAHYVDFSDLPIPQKTEGLDSGAIYAIVISVFLVVALVAVGIFIYRTRNIWFAKRVPKGSIPVPTQEPEY